MQTLLNEWRSKFGKKGIVIGVFLDLKRTFEIIDRKRLFKKNGKDLDSEENI